MEKGIEAVYALLSHNEIQGSLKICADILKNEILLDRCNTLAKENAHNIGVFQLMDAVEAYFNKYSIKNYEPLFLNILFLNIYYKGLCRDEIDKRNDHILKVITVQLLSVLEHRKDYSISNFNLELGGLLENDEFVSLYNATEMLKDSQSTYIYKIFEYYYQLKFASNRFGYDCWEVVADGREEKFYKYIQDEEAMDLLREIVQLVTKDIYNINDETLKKIFEKIESYNVDYIIDVFFSINFNINHAINEINQFKLTDEVVGKNIYSEINQHKEASFHKHFYSYIAGKVDAETVVLSELAYSNQRYDLYFYSQSNNLSYLIELKVNDMANIADNINQLNNYLKNSNRLLYLNEPYIGVLLIYNIGKRKLEQVIEKIEKGYDVVICGNDLLIRDSVKPIIVSIVNMEES